MIYETDKVMMKTKCMLLVCCLVLLACSTQKEVHQHTSHTVNVDSLAHEAQADGHHQTTAVNIDSIVTASIWAAMQEFSKNEQEHEVTTETLTETIDSLGRIIRQQQKTTDRTVSKQELQRQQEQLQSLEVRLSETLRQSDSLWSERISRLETHLRDSLVSQLDKQAIVNSTPVTSWWQKTWSWLKGILVGIVLCVAFFLYRKFKTKIL